MRLWPILLFLQSRLFKANRKVALVMFYCNPCAEKNDWPKTMFKSFGPCEMCPHDDDEPRESVECNEMRSSQLPLRNSNHV
jgi:hypothetical protein